MIASKKIVEKNKNTKRYDRRWMEHNFVYYDQFERFKKAMKEIGVEYEVIYS